MNLTVNVASTDRTAYISWPTFSKEDILNSQVDSCSFETKKYGDKTWKPNTGDEIEILDGASKIFAGIITQVEESIEGLILKYRVQCKDWTHYLDRLMVVEKYEAMTINAIIADINTNYLSGFTIANVDCATVITSITFNRLPVSQCLQLLSEQVNYNWYVDYNKDIHFFAKNSEVAPFSLTDIAGNYIFQSLRLRDDISQMRNKVFVRGGEMVGSSRTDNFTGDGTKDTFALSYKFSNKPTVTVGGASKTVGLDNIDTGYDCYWSFESKYIKFATAPSISAAIVITGTPYIPILIQVQDDASITTHGTYEFSKTDTTIKSKEEAKQYAISQLDAYANKISEGSFQTYESGLRSGQIIYIQSDIRDISESFLIQRVNLQMRSPSDGIWSIELATLRTIGIIDFLQKLILNQEKQATLAENEVLEKYYTDNQTVEVTEEIAIETEMQDWQDVQVSESIRKDPWTPEWVLAPYVPADDADNKREGILDRTFYLY